MREEGRGQGGRNGGDGEGWGHEAYLEVSAWEVGQKNDYEHPLQPPFEILSLTRSRIYLVESQESLHPFSETSE